MKPSAKSRIPLPPGPRGRRLHNLRQRTTNYTGLMHRLHREHGEIVSYELPFMKCCAVFGADLIREVLVTQQPFFKPWFPGDLSDDWKYGSISLHQGEEQRRRSEFMTSAFAGDSEGAYARIAAARTLRLRRRCLSGRLVDMVKEFELFTWDTLVDIVLGRGVDLPRSLGEDLLNFEKLYLVLDIVPGARALKELPLPAIRKGRRARREIDAAIYGAMQGARDADYSGNDVITKYVRAKDLDGAAGGLENDRAIRDELIILLTGFVDAPVGALASAVDLIARHPDVRVRVEHEVDHVLDGRAVEADDFERLTYIRAVLKEVLRVEPPAPVLLPKEAVEDRVLGGFLIPKGTLVHVGLRELHHDPEHWRDASEFRPERWLAPPSAAGPSCPAHGYIPFGAGPHACRGADVAERMCVFALACLAQQARLAPRSSTPPKRNDTAVGVVGPWMVEVQPRRSAR